MNKVQRYNWDDVIDAPGKLMYIDKEDLVVDESYQRTATKGRVRNIARSWSWLACGVIIVANRFGVLYVVDGQHRALAAKSRPEVRKLPCIVYQSESGKEEADAWVKANTHRKMPTSVERFKALKESGNEDAIYLQEVLDRLNIKISGHTNGPSTIKSIQRALEIIKRDRTQFEILITLLAELCTDHPINEWLLSGLDYIGQKDDLSNKRIRERVLKIGPDVLTSGAKEASAYFKKGGPKIWAYGILKELNRGLKQRWYVDNYDGWSFKEV